VIRSRSKPRCRKSCAPSCQRALSTADDEVLLVDGVLAMNELSQLTRLDRPESRIRTFVPRHPERVRDHGGDISPRSGRRT